VYHCINKDVEYGNDTLILFREKTLRVREAYSAVYNFLESKAKEAENAGKHDKVRAYEEVRQILEMREVKMAKDLLKLTSQFEHQKNRGRK